VKAGDPIIELDDSSFQDALKSKRNDVNKAYGEWIEAKTDCTFQEIENESKIKTAEVLLIQKELEFRRYAGETTGEKLLKLESLKEVRTYLQNHFEKEIRKESSAIGDKFNSSFMQAVSDLEGKVDIARSDKEGWLDRAAWSLRMAKKGLMTPSQADADQSRLASMEIALRMAEGALDIFRRFDLEKDVTMKWNDVREAERSVKKEQIQARSKMEQKKVMEVTKRAIYEQELDRLRELERDEKLYKMTAPQDGMVVYFVPEQTRGGVGSSQTIIAQGESVKEGQKLMRIPNLAKMMVNARVHEAMVSKLKGEKAKPTGYSDLLRTTFMIGRHDLLAAAAYLDAYEEMRDKFKEKDTHMTFPGHAARIRIDAYPGRIFSGHVKTVATVASAADFFSSDIKVYQTMVSIENSTLEDNLRPGMSAEVTITADETKEPVLIIPIQSVVGNVAMGASRKVYVLDAAGYTSERDIVVGLSSDKYVEVRSGLQEGERIVINPRSLIPEKSDMKPGTPGTRRGAEFDDADGKKGKKKGEGKGGQFPPKDGGGGFQGGGGPPGPGPAFKKQ
jgi:multidrug efflux pump subunit AcrA (membrane-fusion protein)